MPLKFFIMIRISKKITSCFFKIHFQLYKGRINATSHVIQHPMYGAGHKFRTLHLPVSTTLSEVLDRVSGKLDLSINFSLILYRCIWNFITFITLFYCIHSLI